MPSSDVMLSVTRGVFESPEWGNFWRPCSARARWGSFSAPPDPLAAIGGGILLLRGKEGTGGEGKGRRKGTGKG